jgi:hypothetical protein
MKPPLPGPDYWDAKKAEFAAEHRAWFEERGHSIRGIDPSRDFEIWAWRRDRPGEPLPEFMQNWLDLHNEFENGSHAQMDTSTDKQNARDDAEAMDRVFARYRPTRLPSDPKPKKPRRQKVPA